MNLTFSNVTDMGNDPEDNETESTVVFVVLLFVSGIPSVTNTTYIIVCFRIFSKEFHKLLLLCICLSGNMLGCSTVWYCFLEIFKSSLLTPLSCSISIFLISFGFCLLYSFLFLLNCISYLVVRSYNFGTRQKLNKVNYPLFTGVILGSFFISCSTFIIPHRPVLKTCDPLSLFGEHLGIFLGVFTGTLSILLGGIVITSVLINFRIYYIFFKTKPFNKSFFFRKNQIAPQVVDDVDIETNVTSRHNHNRCTVFSDQMLSIGDIVLDIDTADDTEQEQTSTTKSSTSPGDSITSIFAITGNTKANQHSAEVDLEGSKVSVNLVVIRIKEHHSTQHECCELKTEDRPASIKQNAKSPWMSWERKALINNFLIAFTTVFLTGPFICFSFASMKMDDIPIEAGFVTLIILFINNTISPYLFSWRIPEIRKQFTNICKLN